MSFCPRADHRISERYSVKHLATLTGHEWTILADHPQVGWVWLMRPDAAGGPTLLSHAALDDLDLVIK